MPCKCVMIYVGVYMGVDENACVCVCEEEICLHAPPVKVSDGSTDLIEAGFHAPSSPRPSPVTLSLLIHKIYTPSGSALTPAATLSG